jgi:hypothetical protein
MVVYFFLSIIREKNISQSNSQIVFFTEKVLVRLAFFRFFDWKFTLLLMKRKIFLKV